MVLAAGLLGAIMWFPSKLVILDRARSNDPRLGLAPAFFRAWENSWAESQAYRE